MTEDPALLISGEAARGGFSFRQDK